MIINMINACTSVPTWNLEGENRDGINMKT